MSVLIDGTRVTWGIVYALGLALVAWVFSQKTFAGFRMQVAGLAPAAAAYAGFSEKRNIWIALMLCGATAGLAGICEVAGPIGRLQQQISPGYGFAAIIVAWIGRLHPIGVVFGALLMSLLYLGGESAQMGMGLPSAITGLFQGLLLFYLLAADLFITFRLKRVRDGGARRAEARRSQAGERGMNPLVPMIASTVVAATPLIYAALGETVVEKSGVLNLGIEGMMLIGAVAGFAATLATGSDTVGFMAAAAAGVALSLVFGFLTLNLQTNQVATGLALTLFGIGLSAFVGHNLAGTAGGPRCRRSRFPD